MYKFFFNSVTRYDFIIRSINLYVLFKWEAFAVNESDSPKFAHSRTVHIISKRKDPLFKKKKKKKDDTSHNDKDILALAFEVVLTFHEYLPFHLFIIFIFNILQYFCTVMITSMCLFSMFKYNSINDFNIIVHVIISVSRFRKNIFFTVHYTVSNFRLSDLSKCFPFEKSRHFYLRIFVLFLLKNI